MGQRGVHRRLGCAVGGRRRRGGCGGIVRQGHGRQRHRRQALVGPGHAGPVAGAEGRPAVEQAGRRAGRPHRQRADRRLPRQVPQLRRGLRVDVVPGQARDADDEHPVGGVTSAGAVRRAGRRGSGPASERRDQEASSAATRRALSRRPSAAARAARGRGRPAAGRCRPRRATSPPGGGRPRPAVRRARGRRAPGDGVGQRSGVAHRHQLGGVAEQLGQPTGARGHQRGARSAAPPAR